MGMNYYRQEILPFVFLTALQTEQTNKACLRAALLTQLNRDTAAGNALLPFILCCGTRSFPDESSLAAHLMELGGAKIRPCVQKIGEVQCLELKATFPNNSAFTSGISELLGELLLSPNTRGGLFLQENVKRGKKMLTEKISSPAGSPALTLLCEEMCAFEDYSVDALGTEDDAESAHYVKLSKDYKELLASAPLELFYCGCEKPGHVAKILKDVFRALPRGEIDLDIGTDIRVNSIDDNIRFFEDESEDHSACVALGYRLGACMDDPDPAAIAVFQALLGGSGASLLAQAAEKNPSLLSEVSAFTDIHKGILILLATTESADLPAVQDLLVSVINSVCQARISEEDLSTAKLSLIEQLQNVSKDSDALDDFWLGQTILGMDAGPDEMAALIEEVSAESVAKIAGGLEADAVLYLSASEDT